MRTVEYRGTIQALSSIANSGKQNGPNHSFRFETMVRPDGRVLPTVPIVSGSVMRGGLRRYAAAMMQRVLAPDDSDRLPWSVVHALRTGGALRETKSSGEVLTGEKQAVLRDLIPMFGVFGLSGGGRIMSGRLIVDKAIPVAEETFHLVDHYAAAASLGEDYRPPSIWQLLQHETYTRFADVNDAAASMTIEPGVDVAQAMPKGAGNMLWRQETLVAGTRLYHSLILEAGTPLEVAFFDDLVQRWSAQGRIGGQRGRGMGRVRPEYTRSVFDLAGEPAEAEPLEGTWAEQVTANMEQVTEALSWL